MYEYIPTKGQLDNFTYVNVWSLKRDPLLILHVCTFHINSVILNMIRK